MDRGTWLRGSDTCRCWSLRTGRYWIRQSSIQEDLQEEQSSVIACRTSLAFCDCVRKMLLTFDAFGLRIKRPGFASEPLSGSVDPDVHGLDFVPLRELHVLLLDSFTQTGAGGRSHLICYYNTPEDEEGEMRAGTRLRCALDHMLHNRVRGRKKKKKTHTQKKQNKSSPIVLFFLPERGGGGVKKTDL